MTQARDLWRRAADDEERSAALLLMDDTERLSVMRSAVKAGITEPFHIQPQPPTLMGAPIPLPTGDAVRATIMHLHCALTPPLSGISFAQLVRFKQAYTHLRDHLLGLEPAPYFPDHRKTFYNYRYFEDCHRCILDNALSTAPSLPQALDALYFITQTALDDAQLNLEWNAYRAAQLDFKVTFKPKAVEALLGMTRAHEKLALRVTQQEDSR